MHPRSFRLARIGTMVALVIGSRANAQADTIRGRVTKSDTTPLTGATVTVTSTADQTWKSVRTDSAGAYRVVFDSAAAGYTVAVTMLGYTMQRRPVAHAAAARGAIVADFRMAVAVQALAPVRAVAVRPKPQRDDRGTAVSPGSTPTTLDFASGMSGDLTGDLSAALAMIPGVSAIPDGNGGLTISVFGLSADQNAQTLNGMDVNSSLALRDGLVGTMNLTQYDPRFGRGAGAQIRWNLPSGSNSSARIVHATVDDPLLEWTPPVGTQLGTRFQSQTVSGFASGPIALDRMWYNTSYQFGRYTRDISTLASTPASALQTLGINRDSVVRLISLAAPLGLPLSAPGAPGAAITTSGKALARVDFTPTSGAPAGPFSTPGGTVFYLLGSAGWSNTGGSGASPTAFGSRMTEATHREGMLMADFNTYLFDAALSETKSTFSVQSDRSAPYLALPTASILLNSTFPDGSAGFSSIQAGGNGGSGSQARNWSWETNHDVSWFTWDQHHKFDVYADAELNHFALSQSPNRLGSFGYNSLADFAAGTPASFNRMLSGRESDGQSWQGVLAVSDIFTPVPTFLSPASTGSGGWAVQYGLRADFARFGERPAFNPQVDSLFGRRTDHVPSAVAISPMVGFTYNIGVTRQSSVGAPNIAFTNTTRHSITGGFRANTGTLSAMNVDNVARQTGLPSAVQQLQCIGAAVPLPNWGAYAQSESAVPDRCADGSGGTVFAQTTPPATLYSPAFSPLRSWRGDLKWTWFLTGQFQGWVGTTYALNVGLQQPYDLNFRPQTRFTLGAEAGRLVFVSPSSIVPGSGAVASTESRQFPEYAHVSELRSDLRSEQRQITTGFTYRYATSQFVFAMSPTPPRFNAVLGAFYTHYDNRAQSSGFAATTAGDPRPSVWGTGPGYTHSVQASLTGTIDRLLSFRLSGMLNSGSRYTPRVGSDINGDGYANDRAFVFNPATASDPAVGAGMTNLMANAPRQARNCLRAQVGTIAGQYSCEAPWNAFVSTITITFDSYHLRLGNRGTLVLYAYNPLGGLDQLLHGNNLHGWGQNPFPNSTLLTVKGYDANANRFIYSVNPLFGSTAASGNLYRSPFRLTIDYRMAIGPDPETQAIERYMRPPAGEAPLTEKTLLARMTSSRVNGLVMILAVDSIRRSDSLRLSPEQRRAILALNARIAAYRDSAYAELSRYLISRGGDYSGEEVRERWHNAIAAVFRRSYEIAALARDILTAEQLAWIRSGGAPAGLDYSPDWLERTARGPQFTPR